MNIKRKLKTLAAAFVAGAAMLAPFGAWAATSKATIGDLIWSYTVDKSVATITKVECTIESNCVEGVVTIPGKFGEVPVTVIGYQAFQNQEFITEVVLPSGIITIGESGFRGCKRLTTLELPSTVRTVYRQAFSGCSMLANLKLNEGLTTIGDSAFSGCAALKSLSLPSTVLTLGYGLFSKLPITEMEIPDSVTTIDNDLFLNCDKLESVVVGKCVPRLSYRTFAGCEVLTSVTLKEGCLASIGESCFRECKRLTTLALPSTVRTVGSSAFSDCTALRSVTIDAAMTEVNGLAFSGCTALHYVYFQGDLPTLGRNIFNEVPDRMMVYVADSSSGFGETLEGHPVKRISEKPANADAPYDFYVYSPEMPALRDGYKWSLMVTTNRYVHGRTAPASVETIREGDTIYLSYAFDDYWRGEAFDITNRFALSGAKEETFYMDRTAVAQSTVNYWWTTNATPDVLQNLEPGEYTLTLQLNGDNRLEETDSSNNFTSITFTVVGPPRYTVTFDLNGAPDPTSAMRTVKSGEAVGELPSATRGGYTLEGWFTAANGGTQVFASTKVTANMTYYAHWTPVTYTVTFNANGGSVSPATRTVTNGVAVGDLPSATRSGFMLEGWFTAANGGTQILASTKVTANVTYYAHWTENDDPYLYNSVSGAAPAAAATYDGYLYSKTTGALAGTIQVKVGKPNKDNLAAVKATVIGLDGKKKNLKAAERGKALIAAAGPSEVELVGGEACTVTLGAYGMGGRYGNYLIDGGLNVFMSKAAGDKAIASAVLGKWQGAVNMAWQLAGDVSPYQTLTVTIANKGKAKVAGTLADGTKVTASSQLVVGEDWCCVPVVEPKKAKIAFIVWLPLGGGTAAVTGLADAIVGKPGTLKGGAKFRMGATLGDAKYADYLPNGVPVTVNGAKWTLPKAGKVQLAKDGTVDAAKLLDNPSALKLTYTAKTGAFKGSFKAYAEVNGKPKATTVNVTGVLIDGVGYGAATVKKVGGVVVTIE